MLKAGYHFGETAEMFAESYKVSRRRFAPGMYRNITGNEAIALGPRGRGAARREAALLGGYPITPASASCTSSRSTRTSACATFQAEDEIAAVGAAIGAAFGGAIGVTASAVPASRSRARRSASR